MQHARTPELFYDTFRGFGVRQGLLGVMERQVAAPRSEGAALERALSDLQGTCLHVSLEALHLALPSALIARAAHAEILDQLWPHAKWLRSCHLRAVSVP